MTAGHELIEFTTPPREIVAPARSLDGRRESIENPAQDWLERVAPTDRVVVLGVPIRHLDDLAALHGYVLGLTLRPGPGW